MMPDQMISNLDHPQTIERNIKDLPPEILAHIFKNLDSNTDRTRAMKVCPLWQSIIDETLGLRKWIGNGSEFWDIDTSKWKPLMEITRCGIAHAFVSDITDELKNFRDPSIVKFLHPNLVRRLEFDGFISQSIYENLVETLNNLTTLSFHISTLSFMSVNFHFKSFCPSLQKLSITAEGFNKHHYSEFNMQNIYNNLTSIYATEFPKLKSFESCLPIFLDKELEIFRMLSIFVNYHCETLEELALKFYRRWRLDVGNSHGRTEEEIDIINEQLENININMIDPSTWKLKEFIFSIEERETVCPTAVSIKGAMLEIGLTINDLENPVDCLVFLECVNLVKLFLEADGQAPFEDIAQAPRLMNAHGLPKSLKYLTFRNVYMEHQDVEFISKKLPKLNSLVFVNIGKIEGLGMTVPCLVWILTKSLKIKHLKVKGFNDACIRASYGLIKEDENEQCPTCQIHHVVDDNNNNNNNAIIAGDGGGGGGGGGDADNHVEGEGHHVKLPIDVLEFLDEFMEETNYKTKYMPLIKRMKKGVWAKVK